MDERDPRRESSAVRWQTNAFYVLGLPTECSRADAERTGQRLLGQLELGLASARTYDTPFGSAERTPEKVRTAMAELRDPTVRISHELWARLARDHESSASVEATLEPWRDVMSGLGWRGL
jgi:hypothetical protein